MFQSRAFIRENSVYKTAFSDEKITILSTEGLTPDADGVYDVTERLQQMLDEMKLTYNFGIVMIPEGKYSVSKTVYLPRAVRMIGFGESRPQFILKASTPGYTTGESGYRDDMKYMFWFTGNVPSAAGKIQDANPGTFYSAVSNINFKIEDGNPTAVVMRAHFAQNSFVSHCHFDIGNGKAGIHAVGNEMENLSFSGGDYGIYTGKCSPGWPFVLADTYFEGQRKAAICCYESGMTVVRAQFKNVPVAMDSVDGYWDKQILKDCLLENISEAAFKLATENNQCTQVNMEKLYCSNVPTFMVFKESGKRLTAAEDSYLVEKMSHGDHFTYGEERSVKKTVFETKALADTVPEIEKDIPELPPQNTWVNIRDCGAVGDGETDDTKAILQAIEEHQVLYFPQGYYLVSDTILLKENTVLLGFNPVSTQLVLQENAESYAGVGAPKALLETPQGGHNIVNSIGLDTSTRNPRAVACKWQSGAESYMNDVKFVGGHGRIHTGKENVPNYNPTRTADYDPHSPWDGEFWSLWVTNQGGGTFKDIWSASPYAEAGIYISDTQTKGTMYQVSVEHHVRHEIIMKNMANWGFYAIQTEEEVAESSHCQPFELSNCENLVFANFYTFRVIWVDNSHPAAVKTWNCKNLEFLNVHNYTQMKYTIDNVLYDVNADKYMGYWQLARLWILDTNLSKEMPAEKGEVKKLADKLDYIDSMCKDSKGNVYICDSRLKRIYKWDIEENKLCFVTSMHYKPLSLACDSEDNLLVTVEYKPVYGAKLDGQDELSIPEFEGYEDPKAYGGCFYIFYSIDRRVRMYAVNPDAPEHTLKELKPVSRADVKLDTLYYPTNQWSDDNELIRLITTPDPNCYVAPDGKTGVTHNPALTRATGLSPAKAGEKFYEVDEYNKYIVELDVDENLNLVNPKIMACLGEYSIAVDDSGTAYIPDNQLYRYEDGKEAEAITLPDRPADVLIAGKNDEYLFISARTALYVMKIK